MRLLHVVSYQNTEAGGFVSRTDHEKLMDKLTEMVNTLNEISKSADNSKLAKRVVNTWVVVTWLQAIGGIIATVVFLILTTFFMTPK